MTDHETTTALIDDALDAGRPTADAADDRFLQELVLAVRDDAPAADADFERHLDERVASGFGGKRRGFPAMPVLFSRRPGLAALGVAASLLIALVVSVSVLNREGTVSVTPDGSDNAVTSGGGGESLEAAPESDAPNAAKRAAPQSAPAQEPGLAADESTGGASESVPSPGVGPVPPIDPVDPIAPGRRRNVQRSALLTLAAPGDRLDDVANGVVSVTDRYRGFVMRSSVTSAEDGSAGGSFDLRVPVGNLRPALRDLSQLADVRARTEAADDVTASFRSARTRLEELRAQRRGLLRRLAKADTENEERAIRAQIRFVNDEIETSAKRLRDMDRQTSYAAIAVTLVADENADDGSGSGLGKGWNDLENNLVDSLNVMLRVLGVALPLALIGGLAWFAASIARRRSREAALDRLRAASRPADAS